jgi:hypothetical protein
MKTRRSISRQAGSLILMALAVCALAACSSLGFKEPPPVDPNLYPTHYQEEILRTLKDTLDDPTNVRDAYLSEPALTMVGKDQRYTSCVRYNARDLRRQYVGSKDRIAYYYGGHLNQLVDATPEQCANAAFKPFPELEKLCYQKKCT